MHDSTSVRRIQASALADRRPAGFISTVVAPAGAGLVAVSGQLAADVSLDFAAQVESAFDGLALALAAGGATLRDVVKITCLVVDIDGARLAALSAARRRRFGETESWPASTIIPVPRLAGPGALFEVDAIAAVIPPPAALH